MSPEQKVLPPRSPDDIDPLAALLLPAGYARSRRVLPFRLNEDVLWVAMADSAGQQTVEELRSTLSQRIVRVAMDEEILLELLDTVHQRPLGSGDEVIRVDEGSGGGDLSYLRDAHDLTALDDEAPVIRLVNQLVSTAIQKRASDIHVEPQDDAVIVRYRMDGALQQMVNLPKKIQAPLISRIKVMAHMDVSERRLPQDGSMRVRTAGRDVDVRVSCIPTAFGERAVLRLLDRRNVPLGLSDLGLSASQMDILGKMLAQPHGILLVTGPTGSGKTTTLYGALQHLNQSDRNILTIEDPIEYQLQGVGQMQVNPRIGLTFAGGLRSILRQDPDVIMIGEIRDLETAQIAVQASLTGHMVLATLHTNDAPGAITRLLDMGIEPFLAGSSLLGVIAQRLVRLLCPVCKRADGISEAEQPLFADILPDSGRSAIFRATGCPQCNNTGYSGRRGIFEMMTVNEGLRRRIVNGADELVIREAAVTEGPEAERMVSLRRAALALALDGLTTTEEALRVTQEG